MRGVFVSMRARAYFIVFRVDVREKVRNVMQTRDSSRGRGL